MPDSGHILVDLRKIFGGAEEDNTKPDEATETAEAAEGGTEETGEEAVSKPKETKKAPTKNADWGKILKDRLAANAELDQEARQPEAEIEAAFWDEYFSDGSWDDEVATKLKAIELLLKDIVKLGFKKQTNPVLAFVRSKWVQNELIKTDLINSNTFKAVHNAIAKRYIADSEFVKANNYNILYCKDLYKKPLVDIVKYLSFQKQSLPTNLSYYNEDTQSRNIRIFLVVGQKSVRQKGAKLNSLKEVEKLLGKHGIEVGSEESTSSAGGTSSTKKGLGRQDLLKVISSLTTVAQGQAALQYISMATNSTAAKEALKKSLAFKNSSAEELIAASNSIAKYMSSMKLSETEAEELVEKIVAQLEAIAQ